MKMKIQGRLRLWQRWLACVMAIWLVALPVFAQSDMVVGDIRRDATVNAIETVLPSVVNVATSTIRQYADFYDPFFREFYGTIHSREELNSIGSGVIIDEDGYMLTNLHVLQRATRAQVKLWDGRLYDVDSTNIWISPGSDLALLKLVAKPGEKFKAIKFAPDDDLLLGETVIALGNPFGLGGSVSRGILSSKNRRPPVGEEPLNVQDWLQTDAAINPGNSGGPLVNLRGELIGVNNAVGKGQGIGFAIPVKQIWLALSEALSPEVTDALWFGARVRPVGDGLKVVYVQAGSPADKAGIRVNQQILTVDGKAPKNFVQFNRLVAGQNHEASIQVRDGLQTLTCKVRLVPFGELIRGKLGLALLNPSPDKNDGFSIRAGDGLFIESVEDGSPADQARLQQGFLLKAVDGQPATDLNTVAHILVQKPAGSEVGLTVVVPRRFGSFVEFRQATVTLKTR